MSSRKRKNPPEGAESPPPKAAYPATSIDASCRNMLGRLLWAAGQVGLKTGKFFRMVKTAGYSASESSMHRWRASVDSGNLPISPAKMSGRPRIVSAVIQELLFGFVLDQNAKNLPVERRDGVRFLRKALGRKVSKETIGRIFKKLGLVRKWMRNRTAGYQKTDAELVDMYNEFIKKCRREKRFAATFASLDLTTTTHRNDRKKTYALSGGAQPKQLRKITSFTNGIVTCFLSDGQQYPSQMFTYNRAFFKGKVTTPLQKAKQLHLRMTAAKYGINLKRIKYIGKPPKERRTYASECPEFYETFLEKNKLPVTTIFTDHGKAFKRKKVDIFPALGYEHVSMPADIHQFVSPNDNCAHGTAKTVWRSMDLDHTDDVESTLALMHCLDGITPEQISDNFDTNFQLSQSGDLTKNLANVISGPPHARLAYARACHAKYCHHAFGDPLPNLEEVDKIASDLDGVYWQR